MKKYLIVFLSVLALVSCKKKYTCDCSTLVKMSYNSGSNYSGTFQADKKEYIEKMTKNKQKRPASTSELLLKQILKMATKVQALTKL